MGLGSSKRAFWGGVAMVLSAFKKIADAVKGDDGRGQVQGFLKPIDTDRVAEELQLDRAARERGSQEQPTRDSTSLDSVEQRIVQKLQSEWSWHGAELVNNLKAYASRLLGVTVQTEFARLDLVAQNALAKLRSANHRAESELGPLRLSYISARQELEEFKIKHRLTRSARTSASRSITIGMLVVLVSVEAAANAVFFSKGSDFGLLGGLWTAVCISAVNIVIAFALGFLPLRWLRHRNYLIKFLGLLSAAIGIASIVIVHGLAAHLREVPGTVDEDAMFLVAARSLWSNPFGLHDINSYYLFIIGVVWAIVAIWKGYTFDDPYPGYGAHFRRFEAARETYSEEHDFLFEDLEDIKEDTIKTIDGGITRIPLFPQQAANIRAEREALRQKFKGYESSVEAASNQLLSRYRDANVAARKTPSPRHFDIPWTLPYSLLSDPNVQTLMTEASPTSMDASEALAKLRTMSLSVLDEYNGLMSRYPHPTEMA